MAKQRHKYTVTVKLDVVYLSSDVHDQSFYEMFQEIFQTAQGEYTKYKFSIEDFHTEEGE